MVDKITSSAAWFQQARKRMAELAPAHPLLARRGEDFGHLEGKEKNGAFTTLKTWTQCLSLPNVEAVTQSTTVHPDDFVRQGGTAYLVQDATDDSLTPLHRAILWAFLRSAMRVNGLESKRKVHVIINEAFRVGYMPQFERILAVGRSFGIYLQFYFLNLDELDRWPPGAKNFVLANTAHVFAGASGETARHISQRIGNRTIALDSWNSSHGGSSRGGQEHGHSHSWNRGSGVSQQSEALIRPEQIETADPRVAWVLGVRGCRPIAALMRPYWEKPRRERSALGPFLAAVAIFLASVLLATRLTDEVNKPARLSPGVYRPTEVPDGTVGRAGRAGPSPGVSGVDRDPGDGGRAGRRGVVGRP